VKSSVRGVPLLLVAAAIVTLVVLAVALGGGGDAAARRAFAPNSVWNAPLRADAPIEQGSPLLVSELAREVRQTGAWINTTSYSVPVYTVHGATRRSRVSLDLPNPMYTTPADARALATQLAAVPIPPQARPADGTDAHLAIWQPSTDTMWELWRAHVGGGAWHASWGARIAHVSRSSGVVPHPFGATASGLALAGGLVTVADLRRGHIDHALAMAVPGVRRRTWVAPANRTDGLNPQPQSIPEGTRFRLDPNLNLASLGLPPVTFELATAAQRYGILVRDRANNVAFFAEDPHPRGSDPYPQLFGYQSPAQLLARFPWDRLEVVRP